ncbi:hypothetical protein HaLaN_20872 [Haematococcus lacustris]|uniref:Uncharacterized protein n=1 Tax=Haematococcus lacustris TaxID=44745 RepID=A0A699ZM89_HAELA|nr:hypothetical protein HaLaN_20872 [Haematococcus lacustris]
MEVAVNVVYHAELRLPPPEDGQQQHLTPAGTTPELAVPAGATHNSVAKRASAARLAWDEIA